MTPEEIRRRAAAIRLAAETAPLTAHTGRPQTLSISEIRSRAAALRGDQPQGIDRPPIADIVAPDGKAKLLPEQRFKALTPATTAAPKSPLPVPPATTDSFWPQPGKDFEVLPPLPKPTKTIFSATGGRRPKRAEKHGKEPDFSRISSVNL